MDAYRLADAIEDLITEMISHSKGEEDARVTLYKMKLVKALQDKE